MIFQVAPGVTLLGGPRHASHGSFSGAFAAAAKNAYGDVPKGNADVFNLQDGLVHLASATGRAGINPGTPDGVAGPNTVDAVVQALTYITPHIPTTEAKIAVLGLAAVAISDPSDAASVITKYASELSIAAGLAATNAGDTSLLPPATPATIAPPPPPTWYTTWWGVSAIAVGGLGILMLVSELFAPPRVRAASPTPMAGARRRRRS